MKQKLSSILLAVMLCALCAAPAHAQEYTFDAPDSFLFGRPTSDDAIYEWENPNVDRSKNTVLIPPVFGTAGGYLPGSGGQLTPNLPTAVQTGVNTVTIAPPSVGMLNSTSVGDAVVPSVGSSGALSVEVGFTQVTSGLYYSDGSLGTLKIPSIGLTVGVYEGTDSAALLKGAGHFEGTSIWNGNIAVAGHNRGVRNDFGKIHTLNPGDTITLTTKLGTRTYSVTSVTKVLETDTSGLSAATENCVTMYTCVQDQPAYRWCVRAVAA